MEGKLQFHSRLTWIAQVLVPGSIQFYLSSWKKQSGNVWLPAFLLSHNQFFATPWTVAHQTPLSMGFPGKNTGVGCHFSFFSHHRWLSSTGLHSEWLLQPSWTVLHRSYASKTNSASSDKENPLAISCIMNLSHSSVTSSSCLSLSFLWVSNSIRSSLISCTFTFLEVCNLKVHIQETYCIDIDIDTQRVLKNQLRVSCGLLLTSWWHFTLSTFACISYKLSYETTIKLPKSRN